jgi:hypothetical protein
MRIVEQLLRCVRLLVLASGSPRFGALLVELLVLALKLVAFLTRASAFFASASASSAAIRCSRASMASRIGWYRKRFKQPHQNQEVDGLRDDGEPIDQHGYCPAAWAMK